MEEYKENVYKEKALDLLEKVKAFYESLSKGTQSLVKITGFVIGAMALLSLCNRGEQVQTPNVSVVTDTVKQTQSISPVVNYNTEVKLKQREYKFNFIQDSRMSKEQLDYLMRLDPLKKYSSDQIRMAYNSALDKWFQQHLLKEEDGVFINFEKYIDNE